MNYTQVQLEKIYICGISVRTTNLNGQSQKDLSELWNRFFIEQVAVSIPNKISEEIYCVYTDYESNFMGEYTAILGYKISSSENSSLGLSVKEIPVSTYRVYQSEGKIPECVAKTWMHIWQLPDTDRAYNADFEIYGQEAQNPENAIVCTYLSIKE